MGDAAERSWLNVSSGFKKGFKGKEEPRLELFKSSGTSALVR